MTNGETACCCCRLRTAATVFVVLSFIGSVLYLILSILLIINNHLEFKNYDSAITIVTCVLSSITIVISCVALYGIKKDKAICLLAWVVGYTILIIFNLIKGIIQFAKNQSIINDYGGYQGDQGAQGAVIGFLVATIILFLILAYIINIVRRYYVQLKHQDSANNMASASGQYPQQ